MEDMKKVCVLYGGGSSEREVSLKSGKFIHKSLVKNGYKSRLIDYRDLTELEKLKDFNDEIPIYTNNKFIFNILEKTKLKKVKDRY